MVCSISLIYVLNQVMLKYLYMDFGHYQTIQLLKNILIHNTYLDLT